MRRVEPGNSRFNPCQQTSARAVKSVSPFRFHSLTVRVIPMSSLSKVTRLTVDVVSFAGFESYETLFGLVLLTSPAISSILRLHLLHFCHINPRHACFRSVSRPRNASNGRGRRLLFSMVFRKEGSTAVLLQASLSLMATSFCSDVRSTAQSKQQGSGGKTLMTLSSSHPACPKAQPTHVSTFDLCPNRNRRAKTGS